MNNNWTANRGQLDRMLELERALARHQRQQWRQQQWQQLLRHAGWLHTALTQSWSWRWSHPVLP
jgi:hypothetical protein